MTVQELHSNALKAADDAFELKSNGEIESSTVQFNLAFELEREAYYMALNDSVGEPSESILLRSAATLAIDAKRYDEAIELIRLGLKKDIPKEIEAELKLLYENENLKSYLSNKKSDVNIVFNENDKKNLGNEPSTHNQKTSWLKKLILTLRKPSSYLEIQSRLRHLEYALEATHIKKEISEVDKNQSEALVNILKSVENIPNAAIRIGSLLVIKITEDNDQNATVQVRTLSIQELHYLDEHPEYFRKPKEILDALTKAIGSDTNKNED